MSSYYWLYGSWLIVVNIGVIAQLKSGITSMYLIVHLPSYSDWVDEKYQYNNDNHNNNNNYMNPMNNDHSNGTNRKIIMTMSSTGNVTIFRALQFHCPAIANQVEIDKKRECVDFMQKVRQSWRYGGECGRRSVIAEWVLIEAEWPEIVCIWKKAWTRHCRLSTRDEAARKWK